MGKSIRCDAQGSQSPRKKLCCPFSAAPDPKNCKWKSNKTAFFCGIPGLALYQNKCDKGEEKVVSDAWFIDDKGRDDVCSLYTQADYCCKTERAAVCTWSGQCVKDGEKVNCPANMAPMNKGLTGIRAGACDISEGKWEVMCCEQDVQPDCRWVADPNNHCEGSCKSDEVDMGRHKFGGGLQCSDSRYPPEKFYQWGDASRTGRLMCCKRESVRVKMKHLPVPLEYLFDTKIEAGEEQSFDIDVDKDRGESSHPNDNSFGWHIMSGPPDQLHNLNKRDGSHWEVYGCDRERHEGVQSARLVCSRAWGGNDNNCGDLLKGGVADTVIEMPPHCGASKYAMAVSLDPMHDASTDTLLHRSVAERLPAGSRVYNLTFDYGFHRLQGRADNKVKIRIDYSNAKDYWNYVVAAKPTRVRRASRATDQEEEEEEEEEQQDLDEIARIVKRDHGGDWRRFLDHSYRADRRRTPPSQLHELHERWYTAKVVDWVARLGTVNKEFDVLEQRVKKTFVYQILHEERTCMINDFTRLTLEADIHARISADIQTSGVMTLIGDLVRAFFILFGSPSLSVVFFVTIYSC